MSDRSILRFSNAEIAEAAFDLLDQGVSRREILDGALDATLTLVAAES